MAEVPIGVDAFRARTEEHIASLAASGTAPGLELGEVLPDFVLPDAAGRPVALADRLSEGPVVLSFYRGSWCPHCNRELHGLQEVLPEIRSFGASLLAISTQSPDASLSLIEQHGLEFDVLSDLDQSVIAAYRLAFELPDELHDAYVARGNDLRHQNANGSWRLPIPATFVADRDGVVRARHVDANYRERMVPADVLTALASIARASAAHR